MIYIFGAQNTKSYTEMALVDFYFHIQNNNNNKKSPHTVRLTTADPQVFFNVYCTRK